MKTARGIQIQAGSHTTDPFPGNLRQTLQAINPDQVFETQLPALTA